MGTYSVALPWARMAFCRDLWPPSPSEVLVPNRTRTTPMASTISMIKKRPRYSEVIGSAASIIFPFMGYHKARSEEHTSELQSRGHLVCRLLLEKKNRKVTDR